MNQLRADESLVPVPSRPGPTHVRLAAGWLFVGWIVAVCSSYFYFMLRSIWR